MSKMPGWEVCEDRFPDSSCDSYHLFHSQPLLAKYVKIELSSIFLRQDGISFLATMKLFPQSEWSCIAGPLKARNRRRVLMKLEVSIASINSIWIALVVTQVKRTAQRLLFATPPLFHRVLTNQGPKTSGPT